MIRIAIILLLVLFASCKPKPAIEQKQAFSLSPAMKASSAYESVRMEKVKNEIRLFGKVVADNSRQAHVFPIVSGNVMKISVELGDYVQQGQVLASIRSSEVAGFEREKMDALNDMALSEKNLQVAKDLHAGKLASEKDVLAAERDVEKSRAELKRINEIYSIYNLSEGAIYRITAPISGFIIEKNINQNEQIRRENSDNLFAIAQIDEVWVLANVNESDISKISPGITAEILTISYPDRIFKGKVDKIFNILDPNTKAMKVRIRMSNPDNALKPEMNATVTLKYEENLTLPSVPSTAVIFDKSKYWIMVYKSDAEIETRQVELFRDIGGTAYVSSGITEGEKVFVKNQLLIYDALND